MKAGIFIIIHLFLVTIAGNAQIAAGFTVQPATASCGVTMQFDAHLSSASQGHNIIEYEWDFDYDGITFNVQATGERILTSKYTETNVSNLAPGTYYILVKSNDCRSRQYHQTGHYDNRFCFYNDAGY